MNSFNQTAHKAKFLVPVCWGLQFVIHATIQTQRFTQKRKRQAHIYPHANVYTETHTLEITAYALRSQPLLQEGHLVALDEKASVALLTEYTVKST